MNRILIVSILLLAASMWAEDPVPAYVPGKLVSKWDLTKATDEGVPNSIKGMPALKSGKDLPAALKDGVQFNNGAYMAGKGIPQIFDGKTPFGFEMEIKPVMLPSGYCGGLFQCFAYRKSGWRISLLRNMKLGVSIWTGPGQHAGLNSKSVLELGKSYQIKLWFTPEWTYLYVNGKLEDHKKCKLPAATTSGIMIGNGSGKEYYYNGIIKYITIKKLLKP